MLNRKNVQSWNCANGSIDYGGRIITDISVRKYMEKHLHWWDWLNRDKVVGAAMLSQGIIMGVIDEREGVEHPNEKWYFRYDANEGEPEGFAERAEYMMTR